MSLTADRLYELLPAIIRQRDAAQREPLRALLAVIAREGKVFEDDLVRLLDNLFIETCDDWVVPYLGDLLGVRGLNDIARAGFSQRARVANTLGYRRRKGTATMLEQLARDTTGWPARVVEFFQILETTQWLNHLRPQNLRTPDLRDTNALELVDTAFDTAAHTADVRHIASRRGRHNIPNIGIFLWRLQSYPLENVSPRSAAPADGRYFFHPLAVDVPLFNSPQTETDITHLATEIDVPTPLRRRPLFDELEARRAAILAGDTPTENYFHSIKPSPTPTIASALSVSVRLAANDPLMPIPPEQIFISDLNEIAPGQWRRPDATPAGHVPNVAVDPVLGRLSFAAGLVPAEVLVSAAHGFPGDLGGGPYDRRDSVAEFPLASVDWQAGVSANFPNDPLQNLYPTIRAAVDAWNNRPAGTATGIIAVTDNCTYAGNLTGAFAVQLGAGEKLLLVSADWPKLPVPGGAPGQTARFPGRITPSERRAHLRGDVNVSGNAPLSSEAPGEFWIDGLLIDGALTVLKNKPSTTLGTLHLAHTTLVPKSDGLLVEDGNEKLSVALERTICGPIVLPDTVAALDITESIVDVENGVAIDAPGARVEIQASTIRGRVQAQQLEAGNSIFTEDVQIERLQTGCVRFCYVPLVSTTPRRYRCQPELALESAETKAAQALALARVVPAFTAVDYPAAAYLQLARLCAAEICTGADDGAEMGAWRFLRQPQREANLNASLDEYLRLGLEAGLIFTT